MYKAFLTNINSIPIPRTVSEALSHDSWKDDMKVEIVALEKNKTWELVKLPKWKQVVRYK